MSDEPNEQEKDPIQQSKLKPPTKDHTQSETYSQLQTLKSLYEEGFITETEYSLRKSQLIDQLTGTSMKKQPEKEEPPPSKPPADKRVFIPRPPPIWDGFEAERAIKMTFDPMARVWTEELTTIKVDTTPFAKGGLRMAFHMKDLAVQDAETYVLKVSIDANEDVDVYYRDVEMQLFAKSIGEKFNCYNPPKKVDFVSAWLLKLVRRENQLCAVEKFISGPYRKHNNNYGFVNEDERNTPQAFSHFSYEVTGHQLLVCDIQGVADLYTDPQIHTVAGDDKGHRPFGKGNLGQKGIDQFLKTHRCNPICRYLKLPPINPRQDDVGTVPVDQTVMPHQMHPLQIRVFEVVGTRRLALHAGVEAPAASPGASGDIAGSGVTSEHMPLMPNLPNKTHNKTQTKITITTSETSATPVCWCSML